MAVYPSTSEVIERVLDYKQNFMNLTDPRFTWWHEYPYNIDFIIKVTWGKDNYFFGYAFWKHTVDFGDPTDFGWEIGQIKPFKGWVFHYNPEGNVMETIYDGDSFLWSEDDFVALRRQIKAIP